MRMGSCLEEKTLSFRIQALVWLWERLGRAERRVGWMEN